jgi:hypothetical protein
VQSSHTITQKRRFVNQYAQLGAPKTHASLAPQAQVRPTYFTPVKGSRSSSKLGLQAPNTAGPTSVWCLDLHLKPTPNSWSGKSRNPWQERNRSSRSHKQVYARDNISVTWPGIQCNERSLIDTGGTNATWASLSCQPGPNLIQEQSRPVSNYYPDVFTFHVRVTW